MTHKELEGALMGIGVVILIAIFVLMVAGMQ